MFRKINGLVSFEQKLDFKLVENKDLAFIMIIINIVW